MKEFFVVVHMTYGSFTIGSVFESTESLARCAALSKYGITDDEYYSDCDSCCERKYILPDDEFSVREY